MNQKRFTSEKAALNYLVFDSPEHEKITSMIHDGEDIVLIIKETKSRNVPCILEGKKELLEITQEFLEVCCINATNLKIPICDSDCRLCQYDTSFAEEFLNKLVENKLILI